MIYTPQGKAYATPFRAAAAQSTVVPWATLMGGTGSRLTIYQMTMSAYASPNDYLIEYQMYKAGAFGSAGSTVTPNAIGAGDPAVVTAYAGLATFTASGAVSGGAVFDMGIHLRTPFVFNCVPGHEYEVPATSSNGFHFYQEFVSTSFNSVMMTFHWE